MNGLTESLKVKYVPKMAIIVYDDDNHASSVYLEQRDIENGKMGAGRPLSKACIAEMLRAVAEDSEELSIGYHGKIPKNLLFADTTTGRLKLVWYISPGKHRLYFTQSLGIPDGEIKMPGFVFCVDNNRLHVWAYKGRTPKDELFNAPFFNVNDGSVCLGNAKTTPPKDLTYEEAVAYWEKLFWQSEFSHLYGANPIDGNLATITKDCIVSKSPFPTDVLKLSKTKLKDVLK